jgi:tight adherence protein B
MILYLIYFSVFALAVVAVGGLGSSLASARSKSQKINQRMQLLDVNRDRYAGLVNVRLERGIPAGGFDQTFQGLQRLYVQSGLRIGWSRLAIYGAMAGVLVAAGLKLWLGSTLMAAGFGTATAILAPLLFVLRTRKKRIEEFARQLPDAIDVIVRSLRAGHPVPAAVALVATDMRDPIAGEFRIVTDEMTYGTSIDTALNNLAARTAVDDLGMLAMTVAIQRQTGGNLAEILDSLSQTIRDRFILRMRVRSLTAEGRFSAVFMTMFPIGLYLVIKAIAPDYFDALWAKPWANYFVGSCITLIVLGNLVMRRMVNFRI